MPGDFEYPFKQARHFREGRSGYDAIWIVRHCTDDDEAPTYAEGLGSYLQTTDRVVSAHFGADSNSVMQYVELADTAFCAGSPANARGAHIEHSGRANQTKAQWLDEFGRGLLEQSAQLHTKLHRKLRIPFRRRLLTDDELRGRVPGTTRHADLVRVFGGTHAGCPGANFPHAELDARIAELLTGEDDDMELTDKVRVPDDVWMHFPDGLNIAKGTEMPVGRLMYLAPLYAATAREVASEAKTAAAAAVTAVQALRDQIASGGVPVDYDLLADALAAHLPLDAIAAAVADEHHRRQAE
jgi:hypothetical protein